MMVAPTIFPPTIFLSWSGDRSHRVAKALAKLISGVLHGPMPIISDEHLHSGDLWHYRLKEHLANATFGIVCMTPENRYSPWLNYEAGILSKSLESHVCPYLIAMRLEQAHPLAHFQSKTGTRQSTLELMFDLNRSVPDSFKLSDQVISNAFEASWPAIEKELQDVEADSSGMGRILTTTLQISDLAKDLHCKPDLFTALVSWSLQGLAEQAAGWSNNSIELHETEVLGKGIEVFNRLKKGGFATSLVTLDFWTSTAADYFDSCRRRAQALGPGTITRVFVLDSHVRLFNRELRDQITKDTRAGIDARVCFLSDLTLEARKDFGIWDDELLCMIQTSPAADLHLQGCIFTRDATQLDIARAWRDQIVRHSEPAAGLIDHFDDFVADGRGFLARTAEEMRREAGKRCRARQSFVDRRGSCRWYHEAWQYLRLVGVVSTPDWHADFYRTALRDAFNAGARRVLISGAADYAMLHHVVRAAPHALTRDIAIHVLDLCPTPLASCDLYEEQFLKQDPGWQRVRHLSGIDILSNNLTDESFDLITSDAFLTRFSNAEQAHVVREWDRLLAPGGRVVTTVRLAINGNEQGGATINDRRYFVERVRQLLQDPNSDLRVLRPRMSEILALADEYSKNIQSNPLPSSDHLRTLFPASFECAIQVATVSGEFQAATPYARLVARKTENASLRTSGGGVA